MMPPEPMPELCTADTTRHVIAAFFAATRAMDVEAFVATFATDALLEDPVGAPTVQGHAAIRRFFTRLMAALPTFGMSEERVVASGHRGAAAWLGHGVGTNGHAVTFVGIDTFTINAAGTIQELHAYWDADALFAQLARGTPGQPGGAA